LDQKVGEKMNKGIIMEVKKNYAIAMNDVGVMDKIVFKDNMKVGQKIFYFEDDIVKNTTKNVYRYHNFIKSFGSIAALVLIVFTFFNIIKPQEAYAVVSLDINPSIQIEADSKLNIIKVEGVNDDGKNMDFSDIKNIPLESGIQKIKDKLQENNYLVSNKDVLVGYAFVQKGEDNSAYEKDLMGAINSTFSTEKVTYVLGDKEDVNKAKEQGISLGRYEAASRVADQDIKNKIGTAPVKDITASIKDSESATEWKAQDQKDTNASVISETPEVKPEKPAAEKPMINAPSDTTEPSSDLGKGNDNTTNKSDNGNEVLSLQPDVPAKSGDNNNGGNNSSSSSTVPTTPKDNTINIAPNNGTIENSTTSGKIKDDSNKVITPDSSKTTDKNAKN
jgi:hypothetical protein